MSETVFYNNRTLVGIGSVGIGTTNPTYRFTIDNGSTTGAVLDIRASGITAGQNVVTLYGKALSTSNCALIGWNHIGDGLSTNYLGLGVWNGDNKLNVTAGGNVGIGTTNPQRLFHVYTGVSGNVAAFVSTGGSGSYSNVDVATYLNASNVPNTRIAVIDDGAFSGHFTVLTKPPGSETNTLTERFRIASSGNVGISQTNPQYTLDVNGSIRYSSYAFRFTATVNSTVPITANGKITYSTADASFPYTTITSGGFRATVAGFYFFSAMVMLDNNGTSTSMRCGIGVTSTDTATITYSGAGSMDTLTWFKITNTSEPTNSSICNIPLNGVVYCAANDYVKVYACVLTPNSTKTYSWANPVNYFSGYLISGV